MGGRGVGRLQASVGRPALHSPRAPRAYGSVVRRKRWVAEIPLLVSSCPASITPTSNATSPSRSTDRRGNLRCTQSRHPAQPASVPSSAGACLPLPPPPAPAAHRQYVGVRHAPRLLEMVLQLLQGKGPRGGTGTGRRRRGPTERGCMARMQRAQRGLPASTPHPHSPPRLEQRSGNVREFRRQPVLWPNLSMTCWAGMPCREACPTKGFGQLRPTHRLARQHAAMTCARHTAGKAPQQVEAPASPPARSCQRTSCQQTHGGRPSQHRRCSRRPCVHKRASASCRSRQRRRTQKTHRRFKPWPHRRSQCRQQPSLR